MKSLNRIVLTILFLICNESELLRCQDPEKNDAKITVEQNLLQSKWYTLKFGFDSDLKNKISSKIENKKILFKGLIYSTTILSGNKNSKKDIYPRFSKKNEAESSTGDIILQSIIFASVAALAIIFILSIPSFR